MATNHSGVYYTLVNYIEGEPDITYVLFALYYLYNPDFVRPIMIQIVDDASIIELIYL